MSDTRFPPDRDHDAVAARLRAFADRIEEGYHGVISYNDFGNLFGNEFWNLMLASNMSPRDYFAAHALPAVIKVRARSSDLGISKEDLTRIIAEDCFYIADAMVYASRRTEPTK